MHIAIISDIHDNLVNLEKALKWCRSKNIKTMICCGDVTNGETLDFLANTFAGTIHLIGGNMEIYDAKKVKQYKNISYYGRTARTEINKKIIGICHELHWIDDILREGPCDIIFYGHTHKPWESKMRNGRTRLINPGTLSGMFQKATFATWDTKTNKLELKILELL